jgi:lipopolysaccharide transport system ATP-binding protein
MMGADVVISAAGLGKRYQLGDAPASDSLREALAATFSWAAITRAAQALTAFGRREDNGDDANTLWSLRDVTFDVVSGATLGIIGRNGAGKSTLLKILSRITPPTTGRARIVGRVGSLLEVGTGFHPDLTGRENIYLNGALLGMRRHEIAQKFDEIVAFAEIARFLDTQVKHYSSGMYMRLAFAVAAHLEPDILVVDEVLAVGDIDFQRKCIGKMGRVADEGRTVLFVSHNMAAIRSLCRTAMVLDAGRIVRQGDPGTCIAYYVAQGFDEDASTWTRPSNARDSALAFTRVDSRVTGHQPALALELDVVLEPRGRHKPALIAVDILDGSGVGLMQALPRVEGFIRDDAGPQRTRIVIDLPPLIPGAYFVTLWAGSYFTETLDVAERVIRFEVHESPTPGRSVQHSAEQGHIVPPSTATWEPIQ